MFDLRKEVATWSQALPVESCATSASRAELIDHLYCEIDQARAQGLADELAFAAAVTKLGSGPQLQAEHAKNRSLLAAGCAIAGLSQPSVPTREHRRILLAHALLWAALIIAASVLLNKTTVPDTASLALIVLMGPIWWGSDQLLRRALRS